jgi:hypothetical protein
MGLKYRHVILTDLSGQAVNAELREWTSKVKSSSRLVAWLFTDVQGCQSQLLASCSGVIQVRLHGIN